MPIDQTEYDSRLNLGALGQNHLQAERQRRQHADGRRAVGEHSSLDGPVARGVLGALLGFLAGVGLALLARAAQPQDPHPPGRRGGVRPPGAGRGSPHVSRSEQQGHEIVAADAPLSRVAEAYRAVRSSLLFAKATMAGPDAAPGGLATVSRSPARCSSPSTASRSW